MPESVSNAVPDLFMTELCVSAWADAVRWYVEVLGLRLTLRDEASGFALLAAGPARLALKRDEGASGRGVRLVFRVADVDAEHARLGSLGVSVTPPADHPREPYREIRLTGPAGTPITLFAWRAPG